jgi:catechol 2,3-dioxygenase-like lactoylglutathione lyase family enzyme
MEQEVRLSGISAVMLGVRDLGLAVQFYTGKLGLKVKMQSPQIVLLDAGPVTLGLSPGHLRIAPQVVGATEVVFQVDDVRAAHRALTQAGVTFLNEPRQATPAEWAAHFKDPDGHLLSIFGPEGGS